MDKESPHFGQQIKFLHNAFEQAMNHSLAAQGLTGAQSFFLGFVSFNTAKGIAVHSKDLAKHFKLKHSTVSGILTRLETGGFITFAPDEKDHRLKSIILTEKAEEAHKRSFQAFDMLEKKMLDGFTKDEADLFYLFLMRAADNIGVDYLSEIKKGDDNL